MVIYYFNETVKILPYSNYICLILRDYRPIPELDVYEPDMLDDSGEFSELSIDARRAAEREMRQRDGADGDSSRLFYGKF